MLASSQPIMAKPDPVLVTLSTGKKLTEKLLDDLFVRPRRAVFEWSRVTGQTAQIRLAYPGQHLASAITGVRGSGTAARGIDLADGSEVKSCSRADQLGSCKECGSGILPYQDACPICGSEKIARKTDSHWIFAIKSERELEQYVEARRVVLILFDRPIEKPSRIRVRAWEVWPREARHKYFRWFVEDYFVNNFRAKRDNGLSPAPLNLHPLGFHFFMMNPVLVFEASIDNADSERASVEVNLLVDPTQDRAILAPEPMPRSSIKRALLIELAAKADVGLVSGLTGIPRRDVAKLRASKGGLEALVAKIVNLDERARLLLPTPTPRIKRTASTYRRRTAG